MESNSALFAEFLCKISDQSERPESLLKMYSAAIGCLYEGLSLPNPMLNNDIQRLITGLIKSGTKRPLKRTEVMPITPFVDYFKKVQPDNANLSLKELRLKAITLISLVFMTRPSDLAPRGEVYDSNSNSLADMCLTRDKVVFHEDGSLSISFFGIKNDTARSGFEIRIPPTQDMAIDPVITLQNYIRATSHQTSNVGPLFLSLTKPYNGIKAETVSKILLESIELVGLGGQGYKAKCFRPTAANAAVQAGCDPETAMHIGRWKTREVFFNHYVFPLAPKQYTGDILKYSGLNYQFNY